MDSTNGSTSAVLEAPPAMQQQQQQQQQQESAVKVKPVTIAEIMQIIGAFTVKRRSEKGAIGKTVLRYGSENNLTSRAAIIASLTAQYTLKGKRLDVAFVGLCMKIADESKRANKVGIFATWNAQESDSDATEVLLDAEAKAAGKERVKKVKITKSALSRVTAVLDKTLPEMSDDDIRAVLGQISKVVSARAASKESAQAA